MELRERISNANIMVIVNIQGAFQRRISRRSLCLDVFTNYIWVGFFWGWGWEVERTTDWVGKNTKANFV